VVVVVVVAAAAAVVVWWRPHLHRHQWIVPEYIRTLDSTGLDNWLTDGKEFRHSGQSGVQGTFSGKKLSHDRHMRCLHARQWSREARADRHCVSWDLIKDTCNCKTISIDWIILNHEGRRFDSQCHCIFFFNWPNPSQPYYGPGVASASYRNDYQQYSWLVEGDRRVRLTASLPAVNQQPRNHGKLDVSQTYWPPRPAAGIKTLPSKKTKLRGLSPRANYIDRETAACRRS
jgi:hypothetical protein